MVNDPELEREDPMTTREGVEEGPEVEPDETLTEGDPATRIERERTAP